jgi:tRNA(adenine34) deaminase
MIESIHETFMRQALEQAKVAESQGEVPVGAVFVQNHEMIAKGYNQPITRCDPSAHAEIVVLRDAARILGNYRLLDTTLYVTLEPCIMCVGALLHARITTLVYAATDPKAGAIESVFRVLEEPRLNHKMNCISGVLSSEASGLLKDFFRARR